MTQGPGTRDQGPARRSARLCLKARPTPAQLADRLRPVDGVFPEGLELYLDIADLADESTMAAILRRIEAYDLPDDFAWLVEGPLGSFDGEFFDVTRDAEADRLVVDRIAWLARRLGVKGVNIHLMSVSGDPSILSLEAHDALLARAVPFLSRFVDVIHEAGAVPTIEHVPPVARMRQGGYYFTPVGMASADLVWSVEHVPGLAILPDTSHAGLYLNARALSEGRVDLRTVEPSNLEPRDWLEPLLAYVRQLPEEASTLAGYFQSLQPHVVNAQVSNARGLLGEGLPYGEGDFDLDPAIRWLGDRAEHIVTETLEPNQDDAVYMREALVRMREALA